ncbi:LppU/SCO3897 family protein [Dactylosporangium sp. CA-139066]|uniref:LppU/SCO3897 family protein n=1 Tax=Dactylosporangium sp. CA-139066 TaxID=3239930 RepID=UPI003D8B2886
MTTPDAQPQPPQQQPPVGQPPMGQPPMAPPQPAKKGGAGLRIIIAIVVLVVIGGGVWFFNRDAALKANVGDCLHQKGANDLAIVKCDSADADFSVLGKVENKRETETDAACDQFQDATNTYWEGESGKEGTVLCLKATK